MTKVKQGDTVKVHYTGKLEDGTVFDSSVGRDQLQFTVGSGQIIPGFDTAVLDMSQGDKKNTTISPEHGYGPVRKELMVVVERQQLPQDLNPQVGQQLMMKRSDGLEMVVRIAEVAEANVTLDCNHPLAGKVLVFEIELVEIV
jgi:FKBP-type peptidyl-prolyl cis-trans isomerase 2